MRCRFLLIASALALSLAPEVRAQRQSVRTVFLEPATVPSTDRPVYQSVIDSARIAKYRGWMANESAQFALDLYARAWALTPARARGEPPVYYVALVPGGNQGRVGFRLAGDTDPEARAKTPFIELSPEDWAFETTFLHETGHVILAMLNGGREIPKREIAAIPHTTAALTDRGTAFDEGFAIHLETVAAHFTSDGFLRDRYHHQRFRFGVSDMLGEFHRHAGDLLSFSQTMARYYEVRENNFAFAPAYTGPDYLRVQMEKSRDFSTLRDANQLLQSEGFYASFFFALVMRGDTAPTFDQVREREQRTLAALADMLGKATRRADDAFLLLFVDAYRRTVPMDERGIIDVLLDLSHGVFVDKDAAALWRRHYLGALRVDLAERSNASLEAARAHWRVEAAADSSALYRNIGPQVRAEVPGVLVTLVALEQTKPVSFDVNTVEVGVMRLVPGITEREVTTWLNSRHGRPFANVLDFRRRAGLRAATLAKLLFHEPPA